MRSKYFLRSTSVEAKAAAVRREDLGAFSSRCSTMRIPSFFRVARRVLGDSASSMPLTSLPRASRPL
jgi:hypothetical protein